MKIVERHIRKIIGIIMVILLTSVTVGCSTPKTPPPKDPYAHITADAASVKCAEPAEFYPISRLGFPIEAIIMRHKECLGVNNMFMVLWVGENTEKTRTAAKLLMLMYVDFKNDQKSSEVPSYHWSATFIKIDELDTGNPSKTSFIAFYQLKKSEILKDKSL